MIINANTRISKILTAHPDALEAIVSIDRKFDKLRNPLLRKLMAGRTSLAMAAKIGNCQAEDFYKVLRPLGFQIEDSPLTLEDSEPVPRKFRELPAEKIIRYDVRPILAAGKDPLKEILAKLKKVPEGYAFCLLNSFKPTPLIELLRNQGYSAYSESLEKDLIATWILKDPGKAAASKATPEETAASGSHDYEEIRQKYFDRLTTINVVSLQAPQPMITILKALDGLAKDRALFVYHQRVPIYLLPELEARGYSLVYKEFSQGDIRLIIFTELDAVSKCN